MKTVGFFLITLGMCGWLFFVARHHRRSTSSLDACTLSEIYHEGLRDMPEITSPRLLLFVLLGGLGLLSSLYPAVLFGLVAWIPSGRGWLVPTAVLAVVGALGNAAAIVLSHLRFSFGVSNSNSDRTIFFWVIPAVQLATAAAGIWMGMHNRPSDGLEK